MNDLEWIASLRVDITDETAADGITPAGMLAYLENAGWSKTGEHPRHRGEFWNPPGSPASAYVLVPLDTEYADYLRRTLDLARVIAIREQRGLIGVLLDLRHASMEGNAQHGS